MVKIKYLLMLAFLGLLIGCFQPGQTLEDIDAPKDLATDNEVEDSEATNDQTYETVTRQLYLLDANGYVAAQTIDLPQPETQAVAEQVVNYLIKGGPVTEVLPNGFSGVLPEGTEVLGLNLQENGTLTVDFSDDFTTYQATDEIKILEAMTYSLTQFSNIERIKLQVEGDDLEAMPVDGTPISQGYSRHKGINVTEAGAIDLLESDLMTMYYPSEHNQKRYYIPVTQYLEKGENVYETIVQALMDGPHLTNFSTVEVFDPQTMLVSQPQLQDDILHLEFNEYILDDVTEGIIADEVMETLVRSLTEHPDVEAVQVNVQNIETIFNENGEVYDEPVNLTTISAAEQA